MVQAQRQQPGFSRLIGSDEPPPFAVVNPQGRAPTLVVCDHASNAIPRVLQRLGLEEGTLAKHVAYDVGCAAVARHLSRLLDAPLVLCGYSRLVIDANRHLSDPTSIAEASDAIAIPGNRGISVAETLQRTIEFFHPYHNAIQVCLQRIRRRGQVPAIVSVHSFTPVFGGMRRPWQIGVLWHRDGRVARPLLERLAGLPDLSVGDNEPYNAREPVGYTMDVHAEQKGYPHVLLEIRQDLVDDDVGAAYWAEFLHAYLAEILADPLLYTLRKDDA